MGEGGKNLFVVQKKRRDGAVEVKKEQEKADGKDLRKMRQRFISPNNGSRDERLRGVRKEKKVNELRVKIHHRQYVVVQNSSRRRSRPIALSREVR